MVLFKINGERNSGTNFLHRILELNGFPVYNSERTRKIVQRCPRHKCNAIRNKNIDVYNNVIRNWKHGVPMDRYKQLDTTSVDPKVVDIFIFRELESWLVSMFKNPYELVKSFDDDFKQFLEQKHFSTNYWMDFYTNKSVNISDDNKSIFEIRKYKFDKIQEYQKKHKDVIFVNLSYVQNEENLQNFLNTLRDKYLPHDTKNYILSIPHTKNKTNVKNVSYNINIADYKDIINLHKNNDLEDFINNLTTTLVQ